MILKHNTMKSIANYCYSIQCLGIINDYGPISSKLFYLLEQVKIAHESEDTSRTIHGRPDENAIAAWVNWSRRDRGSNR
jgi:hypothetical protein